MNPNEQPMVTNNVPPVTPTINTPSYSPVNNNHKKVGPIIAILVIVLVLIIAALYLFASRINQQTTPINTENPPVTKTVISNNEAAATTATQSVPIITNTSDDLQSMQNDLDASMNGLDNQNF